eukprot:7004415-Lingulodinium_polyedra.AAC.1
MECRFRPRRENNFESGLGQSAILNVYRGNMSQRRFVSRAILFCVRLHAPSTRTQTKTIAWFCVH